MDVFEDMGNYFMAFPDAPALAVHMALNGPPAGLFGYDLAALMINTSAPLETYPTGGAPFEGLG
jgi:hypothetical protein